MLPLGEYRGVQVGLRLPYVGQLPARRPVALPGDEQLLCGELRDDLTAVRCDHDLLLDAGRRVTVAGRKYWTAGGALSTLRESQSHLNTANGAKSANGTSRPHGGDR